MAKFKKAIKDNEDVYLVTHENAVIDNDGITIPEKYATKEEASMLLSKEDVNATHTNNNIKLNTNKGVCNFHSDIDGCIDNIYIEGETLVNLVTKTNVNTNANGHYFCCFGSEPGYKVITNGTYTLYNNSNKRVYFEIADLGGYNNYTNVSLEPFSITICTLSANQRLYSYVCRPEDGWASAEEILHAEIMVIRGDHRNKDIHYFVGTASIGHNDGIAFLNMNLDCEKILLDNVNYTYGDGFLVPDTGLSNGNIMHKYIEEYIEVEEGAEYIIEHCNNICIYDENKKHINMELQQRIAHMPYPYYIQNVFHTFITSIRIPKGAKYLRTSTGNNSIGLVTIYKNPKYSFQSLPASLKSTNCGVNGIKKDILFKSSNHYIKYSNCSQLRLTGLNEDYVYVEDAGNTIKIGVTNLRAGGFYSNSYSKPSEILPDSPHFPYSYTVGDFEHWYIESDGRVYINIAKERLTRHDANGLSEWLRANPLTFVIEADSKYSHDYSNINIKTFKGDNRLYVNSGSVTADCNFEITTNFADTLEQLKISTEAYGYKKYVTLGDATEIYSALDFHNKYDIESYVDPDYNTRLYVQSNAKGNAVALPTSSGILAVLSDIDVAVDNARLVGANGHNFVKLNVHLDDMVKAGVYNCTEVQGTPWPSIFNSHTWWFLEVFTHSYATTHIYQRLTCMVGYNWTFDRKKEGSWSEWRCINPPMFGTQSPTANFNANYNGLVYIQY